MHQLSKKHLTGILTAGLIPSLIYLVLGFISELSIHSLIPLFLLHLIWGAGECSFATSYRNQTVATKIKRLSIPNLTISFALLVMISSTLTGDQFSWQFPISSLGMLIGILGISLRLVAIRQLGHRFTDEIILIPGQEIERNGIYRLLRHPAEIGFLLIIFGHTIITQSIVGIIGFLFLCVPISLVRMNMENQMIRDHLSSLSENRARVQSYSATN